MVVPVKRVENKGVSLYMASLTISHSSYRSPTVHLEFSHCDCILYTLFSMHRLTHNVVSIPAILWMHSHLMIAVFYASRFTNVYVDVPYEPMLELLVGTAQPNQDYV